MPSAAGRRHLDTTITPGLEGGAASDVAGALDDTAAQRDEETDRFFASFAQSAPDGAAAPEPDSESEPQRTPARGRARELVDDLRHAGGRGIAGLVCVAVLVTVSLVLVGAVVQQGRDAASEAAQRADRYRPPALETVTPIRGDLALIGDETASPPTSGRLRGWPAVTANRTGLDFTVLASSGSGYLTASSAGRTFVEQAREVPSDVDYVLIVGGIHDLDRSALKLTKAATETVAAAHARAPRARILMVGPLESGSADPDSLRTLRRLLRGAAAVAEVTWLDPIAGDWLLDEGDDGSLTGAEARRVAARVAGALEPLPE